ncbi:MAG TPA: phospho-N-acetylmuramoyl-pentapeptide-transferase [Phycisphaerae bacterium]|nr:phospho-N-acetylmuramoyl-pentapeptide-transferase [Phycisphaerae bacterium]
MLYYLFHAILQGEHYAYENALFRSVCAAIFCFVLVVLAGKPVIRTLVRLKIGDRPEFDHETLNKLMSQKSNVPTMGGVLIIGAVLVGILLFAAVRNFYVQMGIFCLVWLGVLGAVDDWLKLTAGRRAGSRDGLRSYEKLLFQFGLGVLLGYFVYRHGQTNVAVLTPVGLGGAPETVEAYRVLAVPFYKHGVFLSAPLFMIVTVLLTTWSSNAVNLTDGMDGLAAGCVAAAALVLMLVCDAVGDAEAARRLLIPYIHGTGELCVICGAILGASAGFLWYNCNPALVFMGDTGSLPLGGALGYVAIVTRQELLLLIVGGVFVMEALSVMIQVGYFKISGGKRVFRCAPIHHHFQLGGWSETQTVVRFWLIAAMCAGAGLATLKLR